RSDRAGYAGGAVRFTRSSRVDGPRRSITQTLSCDYEHAAFALPETHSRTLDGYARGVLCGSCRLGGLRSRIGHAGESRSAGLSAARSTKEHSPGRLTDQFQGGTFRSRRTDG